MSAIKRYLEEHIEELSDEDLKRKFHMTPRDILIFRLNFDTRFREIYKVIEGS